MYYSPWYSYRLFKQYIGLTPATYQRKLKLSKAAISLKEEKKTISKICYDYGYDSFDGFTRAFTKEFGIAPSTYAKKPSPIFLFTPYKIYQRKKKKMKEVCPVYIRIEEFGERRLAVKRGKKADNYWDYGNEVGCDIWGELCSMAKKNEEPLSLWLPKQMIKPNTSLYVQGIRIEKDDVIPEDLDELILPRATYLVFTGLPFAEEDFESAIENVEYSIEKFDPTTMGYTWDETNPKIQLEPIGTRGYIEYIPVKKIQK
jgi:AraC family transcriptional regulator